MEGARGAEEKRRREDGRETSKRDGGASQLGDRTSEFETRAAEGHEKKTETKEKRNERPIKFQILLKRWEFLYLFNKSIKKKNYIIKGDKWTNNS